MHSPTFIASLAAAIALPTAFAHGTITQPAAVWQAGYAQNGYASTVDNVIWGEQDGSVYGYGTNGTLEYFETNFATSGYTSLKDLILAKQTVLTEYGGSAACGYTIKDEAKRATLPSTLQYSGFTHPGPCEVWCDNTKLAYALDCQTTYPSLPASIPIDTSKCTGADRLTVYWLAVHGAPWQVYNDCVWLTGSTGGSSSSASSTASSSATSTAGEDDETVTTAPTATTSSPASASASASTSTASSDEASGSEDTTPEPTTETPATTTPATTTPATTTPATTSKTSCTKRRHV